MNLLWILNSDSELYISNNGIMKKYYEMIFEYQRIPIPQEHVSNSYIMIFLV